MKVKRKSINNEAGVDHSLSDNGYGYVLGHGYGDGSDTGAGYCSGSSDGFGFGLGDAIGFGFGSGGESE